VSEVIKAAFAYLDHEHPTVRAALEEIRQLQELARRTVSVQEARPLWFDSHEAIDAAILAADATEQIPHGCSGGQLVDAVRELQSMVGDLRAKVSDLKLEIERLKTPGVKSGGGAGGTAVFGAGGG
jgi:hypothetical protein